MFILINHLKCTFLFCFSVNVFLSFTFFVESFLSKSFIWNRFLSLIVFFLGADPGGVVGLIDLR
jgi:hypothetical protein